MAVEFQQRVRQVFDAALGRPEPERRAFIRIACAGDVALLEAVEQLLRAGDSSGEHIGRYQIRGELGRGAMGVVYDAIDPLIGRRVAVKVILLEALADPSQAEFLRDRLFREARSAGQLFHPGIVVILDVGQDGGRAFIAMERVEGKSLQQTLAAGPLDTEQALEILRQTAAALDFAHAHGVIHRDIKPGNIMLQDGSLVKVADFGIAKVISTQSTMTSFVMGTPSYMSPEQIEAQPVDGRSDQFSLAVVAYELLTGTKPFQGESLATLAYMIIHGNRPSARAANPRLPGTLDEVFQRGLGRRPEDRYQTCAQFVAALAAALDTQTPPIRIAPEPVEAVKKTSKLAIYATILASALVVLGVCGFLFYRYTQSRAEPVTSHIAAAPIVTAPIAAAPTAAPPIVSPPVAPGSNPAPKPPTKESTSSPVIQRFQADPPSIEPGMSTKLSWGVTGAKEVTLDQGIGRVVETDTMVVTPRATITYVMTATGAGSNARSSVTVEVKAKTISAADRARQLYDQSVEKRHSGLLPDALALLRQSADLGEARAMVDLGEAYRDGEAVTKDEAQAVAWYRRAADAGNASGMIFLGYMYQEGEGVAASNEEAVKWFQRAADRGNPSAMYNLATKYERGEGVAMNLDRAKELYRKSAELGNTEAQRRLAQLERRK